MGEGVKIGEKNDGVKKKMSKKKKKTRLQSSQTQERRCGAR